MKRRIPSRIQLLTAAVLSVSFAAALLIAPQQTALGVRAGLSLCAQVVIPSLFPFMVLADFLVLSGVCRAAGKAVEPLTKKLFRLPGAAGTAILMSLVGGFPVGAKMTARLLEDGELTKNQAARMMMFCVNAGPAFVIGAVGTAMLGSRKAGVILYASLSAASLLTGILTRFLAEEQPVEAPNARPEQNRRAGIQGTIVESVAGGAKAIISVCAWVVFFACLCSLADLVPAGQNFGITAKCLLEVTSGCAAAAGKAGLPVLAVALGWAGFSVHCQVQPYSAKTGIKATLFLTARAVNGAFAGLFTSELVKRFPCDIEVFSNNVLPVASPYSLSVPAAAALLVMGALLILDLEAGRKVC